MAQGTTEAPKKQGSGSRGGRRKRRRRSQRSSDGAGGNVAAVRELVVRSVLAPVNAVLLTRRHIEEVVDDAVKRGRMTRDDAQQVMQSLLQRGAKQTDDFLSDLERLLGRSRADQQSAQKPRGKSGSSRRPRKASGALPIANYDDLSAAAVQDRLDGLAPAELRRLRDYERRHANRKTVLDPIERKLR
jgi:polyhydroxyalkanoate synthesis regulator phasin